MPIEHQARRLRRTLDCCAAAILLVLLSPLMLIIYATLKILGEKPIFLQERIGHRSVPFTILKFRTFPELGWETVTETCSPSRVKALRFVTNLLRKTGIDELPQLWNIVRGDMRFIGPRPLTPEDFAELPDYRDLRCRTRPGITGLAQVNGGQLLDPDSKLALDLYLIERPSLTLKFGIVGRSIARVAGLTKFVGSTNKKLLWQAQNLARSQSHFATQSKDDIRPSMEAAFGARRKA